ncbi:aldolase/citrate lyase family protein [Xanthobacter flavus]|uniref:aldolase/citrate lyase family protein n=1 Tax=Xanthobacter flavus TaxID=281 RepID=UPI003734FDFF
MTDVRPLDLALLRRWIGREKTAEERVTHGLAERFGATFEEHTRANGASATVPRMLHGLPCATGGAARASRRRDFTPLPVIVRVNGAGTSWHDADLAAVARLAPAAVMLPKVEQGEQLDAVAASRCFRRAWNWCWPPASRGALPRWTA